VRICVPFFLITIPTLLLTVSSLAWTDDPPIGEQPVIQRHLDHRAILDGSVSVQEAVEAGRLLFAADFNRLDGAGRPQTDGTGAPRLRREGVEAFNRVSGPDANACSGCHNKPRTGGGGDNVANVFVLAQRFGFVDDFTQADPMTGEIPGTLSTVGNERNTPGMWGAGAIEMLAREMTADLHAIRSRALALARQNRRKTTLPLQTKGVHFGSISAYPDATVDTSAVEGVDPDLIIKPFHQKGVVVSLRQFTNTAFNHHHGIQSVERFGRDTDPDQDGVRNELTEGDITTATLFQASLAFPGQVIPRHPKRALAVHRGEQLFEKIGCAHCHRPVLELKSRYYTEPNPYNPPGNLRPQDDAGTIRLDLTRDGEHPRPRLTSRGTILVRAYTDLKRHDLGDDPRINNERLVQAGVPTRVFLTKRLWGGASEPPFLHNGRATLLTDAIDAHGGEAANARRAFWSLSEYERACVIEFLKSLQVLPPNTRQLVIRE
jgi:hypothetical protein